MNEKWYAKPAYNEYYEAWMIVYHREGSVPWRFQLKQGDFHADPKTSKPRQMIDTLESQYECEFVEARREAPWLQQYIATFKTRKKCKKALSFIEAFFLAWAMEDHT